MRIVILGKLSRSTQVIVRHQHMAYRRSGVIGKMWRGRAHAEVPRKNGCPKSLSVMSSLSAPVRKPWYRFLHVTALTLEITYILTVPSPAFNSLEIHGTKKRGLVTLVHTRGHYPYSPVPLCQRTSSTSDKGTIVPTSDSKLQRVWFQRSRLLRPRSCAIYWRNSKRCSRTWNHITAVVSSHSELVKALRR